MALLGLAFKPNTDDMRGASSLVLAARLQAEGAMSRVRPDRRGEARELMPETRLRDSAPCDAVADADAVVLVTEWPEFVELDWGEVARAMRGRRRDRWAQRARRRRVRAAGLVYEGIGRGS